MRASGKIAIGRRQFLHALGVSAAATAASPLTMAAKADSETNDERRKSRYVASDHVKTYYRVNRYPN